MKNFLTEGQRKTLKSQHRAEKHLRTGDRIKAVLLADIGWSYKTIGQALFLDQETVSRHVKEYLEKAKLAIQTGGSQSKLNEQQTQELMKHLEENTYLKVEAICTYVASKYQIQYSLGGMTNWLKSHRFSYKKPQPTPAKADLQAQKEFISYYQELKEATPSDEPIIFLDAVHPTMATKVSYGWIKKGTDKPILTTGTRTRMNIIGGLNLKRMEVIAKDYQTVDSQSMSDYWSYLRNHYPGCTKVHVILDRGPYNVSQKTKDEAFKQGIKLHYLPAYSPNLNPIERLWKVMNEEVRNNRFFSTATEFREAIKGFFERRWPEIAMAMKTRINDKFQTLQKSLLSS
jgi:transposase